MKGIFTLDSPEDLLKKLEHDYSLMSNAPNDPYLAFNFFVTAEHLLDWLYPGSANKKKRTQARKSEILLEICSHIASGAKHFQVEAPHHRSVHDTVLRKANPLRSPIFESSIFYGGGVPGLRVELYSQAKKKYGSSIQVIELAKKILQFWRAHPELGRSAIST
jgi:hypothetical protein